MLVYRRVSCQWYHDHHMTTSTITMVMINHNSGWFPDSDSTSWPAAGNFCFQEETGSSRLFVIVIVITVTPVILIILVNLMIIIMTSIITIIVITFRWSNKLMAAMGQFSNNLRRQRTPMDFHIQRWSWNFQCKESKAWPSEASQEVLYWNHKCELNFTFNFQVSYDDDKFQISLDAKNYKWDPISHFL